MKIIFKNWPIEVKSYKAEYLTFYSYSIFEECLDRFVSLIQGHLLENYNIQVDVNCVISTLSYINPLLEVTQSDFDNTTLSMIFVNGKDPVVKHIIKSINCIK